MAARTRNRRRRRSVRPTPVRDPVPAADPLAEGWQALDYLRAAAYAGLLVAPASLFAAPPLWILTAMHPGRLWPIRPHG